ncbi:MAG: VOC family protein [Candidatus Binatia bacterium]
MAFKITRVGHLVLKVKDLERSRKFFTEVLGFPQVGENDRGMIFFSFDVKDNHHMLALREAKPGAAMPDLEQVGMEHVSFEVATFAELQEVYRKFKQHDVKLRHTVFHGVAKSIYFYDPDGNVLEVYCNVPPEEYRKTVSNPYYNYGTIDDELDGRVPQKPGTVAP